MLCLNTSFLSTNRTVDAKALAECSIDSLEIGHPVAESRLHEWVAYRGGRPVDSIRGPTIQTDKESEQKRRSKLPRLTAADSAERDEAVAIAARSFEWAARFEARSVVWPGEPIPFADDWRELLDSYEQAAAESGQYPPLGETQLLERRRSGETQAALDNYRRSLEELLDRAERFELDFALETPAQLDRIPALELESLLDEFRGSRLSWRLDALNVAELGRRLPLTGAPLPGFERLEGVSLTDRNRRRGGVVPGRGEIDWEACLPELNPQRTQLKVVLWLEAGTDLESVEEGLLTLEKFGWGRRPPAEESPFPILGQR